MGQSLRMLSAGLLATPLLALPAQAQVQTTEVEPADHSSVVHTHANTPAVVSGAVTFRVAYSAAVMVAATLRSAPARAASRGSPAPVYVNIAAPSDLTRRVPRDTTRRMHEAVQRTVREHAPTYATSADTPPPSKAELAGSGTRAFYIGTTIAKVSAERKGRYAEIACSISVRVSPWTGRDGHERLVAGSAASATGNGKVLGAASRNGINDATRECILAVAEEVIARQVVPFLHRVVTSR
jgi:hypothetical protein